MDSSQIHADKQSGDTFVKHIVRHRDTNVGHSNRLDWSLEENLGLKTASSVDQK